MSGGASLAVSSGPCEGEFERQSLLGQSAMKKLAIGCGAVLLILIVAASVVFYVVAFKAGTYLRESRVLESIETLGKGVTNTAPFTPPANGELTADMVKRFAGVQDAMVARLGGRFQELAAMQDEMLRRQAAEHRKSTSREDFKDVSTEMAFVLQAQGAWIDALNQQRFSMDEYQWVRGRVYAAAGLSVMELTNRAVLDTAKEGGVVTRPIAGSVDPVSQRNKELVAPYIPTLKKSAALAFFGL
jgi:hypothetical protein